MKKKVPLLSLSLFLLFLIPFFLSAQTEVDQLIGINARAKDHLEERLKNFVLVREYHDWALDATPTGSVVDCNVENLQWNPTADPTDFTHFDDFYSDLNGLVFPVLKGSGYSIKGIPTYDLASLEQKPYCQGYSPAMMNVFLGGGATPSAVTPIFSSEFQRPNANLASDDVYFWFDPIYGKDGEIVTIRIKVSGFHNVQNFSITAGWGSSWFDANFDGDGLANIYINPLLPGVSSADLDYLFNSSLTLSAMASGANVYDLPDNSVLLSVDLKIEDEGNPGDRIFRLDTPFPVVQKSFPASYEINFQNHTGRFLNTNETAFFSRSTTTNVPCNTSEEHCFEVVGRNFSNVESLNFNFTWNTAFYAEPTQGDISISVADVSADLTNTAYGELLFSLAQQMSPGLTISPDTEVVIAEVCLDKTCNDGSSATALGTSSSASRQELVETWTEHALWLSAFAARYGASASPSFLNNVYSDLLSSTEDANISGLGNIQFFENNNEPDKVFFDNLSEDAYNNGDSDWYFTPLQFAAMSSCDYDGHGGTVQYRNEPIGIKNMNGSNQMVMAGLTGFKVQYIQEMVDWFAENRTGFAPPYNNAAIIPFDVINVHHYCNDYTGGGGNTDLQAGSTGISPEDDGLVDRLSNFLQATIALHPEMAEKKYWFSEYGYDTDPRSPQAALMDQTIELPDGTTPNLRDVDFNTLPAEQKSLVTFLTAKAQADWLVRSIFAIAAAQDLTTGKTFDASMIFCIKDAFDQTSPGLFETPGLVKDNGDPKKSWFWVMTVKNILAGYTFDGESNISTCSDTRMYRFTKGDDKIYAIWDTGSDGEEKDCDLDFSNFLSDDIDENFTAIITFKDGDENGKKQLLSSVNPLDNNSTLGVNGKVIQNFPVTETPKFIIFGESAEDPLPCIQSNFTSLSCDALSMTWTVPTGTQYEHFDIYILPDDNEDPLGPVPDFDLANTRIQQVATSLGGSVRNAVLPFLEECGAYWVYIVGTTNEGVTSEVCGTYAALNGNCSCQMELDPAWISEGDEDLFTNISGNGFCSLEDGVTSGGNASWEYDLDDIIIDFYSQQYIANINVVYLFDAEEEGVLTVDYEDIGGGTGTLFSYNTLAYNEWKAFANFDPASGQGITKLIIRRSNPNMDIEKFLFCGTLELMGAPNPFAPPVKEMPSTLTWLNSTSVKIDWNAGYNMTNHPESGRAERYLINYSNEVDVNGDLVDPIQIAFDADPNLSTYDYTLSDPKIDQSKIQIAVNKCECKKEFLLPTFKKIIPDQPRASFVLMPNPSTGMLMVQNNQENILRLEVYTTGGERVYLQHFSGTSSEETLNLNSLAVGIYFVRIQGVTGNTTVEKWVVQH